MFYNIKTMKNIYTLQINGNIVIYTMTERQFNFFCDSNNLFDSYNFEVVSVEPIKGA